MALIWFRLHDFSRNLRLINAALKAIDLVKLAQPMRNPNPGLFGGIPGSDPVHGPYIQGALPTGQRNFLSMHCSTSDVYWRSWGPIRSAQSPLQALAKPHSAELFVSCGASPQYCDADDRPLAEGPADADRMARARHRQPDRGRRAYRGRTGTGQLRLRLRNEGLSWIATRRSPANNGAAAPAAQFAPPTNVLSFCRSHGIAVLETGPLESASAIATIRALSPDLGIHAGARPAAPAADRRVSARRS